MIISVLSVCSLANVYVVYSEIGARKRADEEGRTRGGRDGGRKEEREIDDCTVEPYLTN